MAFNIPIKVDDGDSASRITKIEQALAKAEDKTTALGRACDRLSRNFASRGDIKERRARASEIHARLNNTLAQTFDRLGQSIAHERSMLQSIHGNMEAYARDVAALNSLMARGTITAREYDAALASSSQRHGVGGGGASPLGSAAGGVGAAIGGELMAIAGPAALAATAMSALVETFERMGAHQRMLDNAANSLLRFYGTIEQARAATGEFVKESQILGVTVDQQIEAFDTVSDATEGMTKTHSQLMDITRNLSMAMINEGKSINDVGRVMEQLQFGMSKGTLEFRELKSIVKEFPEVGDMFAKSMNVSVEEMLKMGKAGQIHRQQITQMISGLEDGSEASRLFAQRQLDVKQVMDQQHVSLFEAIEIVKKHRQAVEDSQKPLSDWEKQIRGVADAMTRLDVTVANLDEKLDRAQTKYVMDSFNAQHQKNLKAVTDGMKAYSEAVAEATRRRQELARLSSTVSKKLTDDLVETLELEAAQRSFQEITEGITDISASISSARLEGIAWERTLDGIAQAAAKYRAEMESANDGVARGFNAIDKEIHDTAGLTEHLLTNAFHNLEDAIVQAAVTGKLSFSGMIDSMIADLARLALRKIELGIADALFPGASLAPGVAPLPGSAGLNLKIPGFAAGGTARVDTDSMFLGLRVTPNERVIVQTPGQQMAARDARMAPAAAAAPIIINQYDPRALLQVLQTREGATVLHNVLSTFPGLMKR